MLTRVFEQQGWSILFQAAMTDLGDFELRTDLLVNPFQVAGLFQCCKKFSLIVIDRFVTCFQ